MKKDFIRVIEEDLIKVGYVLGNEKVLFIKCGQGGSVYGYDNKYLDLAWHINEKYGYSAFVSEIADDGREAFEREMGIVKGLIGKDCKIYYLGISKGGLLGLWHGASDPSIEKMITVNAPLMINFHNKTRPSAMAFGRKRLTMVYGTLDPSYKFVSFIAPFANAWVIEGADHNLVGSDVSLDEIVEHLIN